jgi:vancomycin resistance protein YoaR
VNYQPSTKKRRIGTPGFWILIVVGAVVAVCVLAILVDSARYYNKVHAGVSVSGIALGGQSKEEATASLEALVDQSADSPITVQSGDQTWTVIPADVGTSMDVEGAVKTAMAVTREHNFFTDLATRWKLYFAKRDLPLNGTVDDKEMATFVAGVAEKLDIQPVNAALAIDSGKIKVIEGVNGQVVDQTSLAKQLSDLLVTLHSTTVDVPIVTKEPDVTADDNKEAQQQAEIMISAPVTVADGDKTWTVTPDTIASSMSFKSEMKNGVSTLVPFMDATKLQPLMDKIAPDVVKQPVNATFKHDDTHAWVVEGKNGEQLDADATAQAITAATLEPSDRAVKVAVKVKEPDLTTQEAKDMGISDKLNSYNTKYSCPAARQTNVKLATKYATNVFLAPGQEYNFDKQIGPRIASRGWALAPGIVGPNQLEDVLGGGICQVSTTMFNAIAGGAAGLKITERHNHSLYINHYPKGRDATVTGGGKNLRFVNDTDHYIWITGTSSGVSTTITVWGTNQGRSTKWTVGDFYNVIAMTHVNIKDPTLAVGKNKVTQGGQRGMSLKTNRVVTQNGKVIWNNVFISSWPMYPETVLVGTMSTTTTTKPPTTTSSTTSTTAAP